MNLTELHGYKQYMQMNLEDIATLMMKHGHRVANGAFAVTLIPKSKSYVYKLYTQDKGYEAYIDFLKEHQSSHYVKIFRTTKLPIPFIRSKKYPFEYVNIVKLEKLTPIPDSSTTAKYINIVYQAAHHSRELTVQGLIDALPPAMDYFLDDKDHDDSNDSDDDYLDHHAGVLSQIRDVKFFLLKHKSFFETYCELIKFASDHNLTSDLHPGNIMLRGTELVVTDPFADLYEVDAPDNFANLLLWANKDNLEDHTNKRAVSPLRRK